MKLQLKKERTGAITQNEGKRIYESIKKTSNNKKCAKYRKKAITRVVVDLNHFTKQNLIDIMATKENKQGYIKSLIKKDNNLN